MARASSALAETPDTAVRSAGIATPKRDRAHLQTSATKTSRGAQVLDAGPAGPSSAGATGVGAVLASPGPAVFVHGHKRVWDHGEPRLVAAPAAITRAISCSHMG